MGRPAMKKGEDDVVTIYSEVEKWAISLGFGKNYL